MLIPSGLSAVLVALILAATAQGENFTIINGQIFTPGLAIVDAPQPNTPLGGGKFSNFFTRNSIRCFTSHRLSYHALTIYAIIQLTPSRNPPSRHRCFWQRQARPSAIRRLCPQPIPRHKHLPHLLHHRPKPHHCQRYRPPRHFLQQ